ncbi:MAG: FecR domain-containing protein [Steroidobacteraceae bacterium]
MDANERRRRAGEQAVDWMIRLQSGALPRAQREQFADWLRESPLHVAEMLRVAQLHNALEQFAGWSNLSREGATDNDNDTVVEFPAVVIPVREETQSPVQQVSSESSSLTRHSLWIGALAASVLVIMVGVMWFWQSVDRQTIETERGERRIVALSDGSVLQVDPDTRLRVEYRAATRQLFLERGRALFRVAKGPQRPFLVRANDTVVRAVGTAFGVERTRLDTTVTVAEGKVAVLPAAALAPSLMLADAERPESGSNKPSTAHKAGQESPLFLTANQQVTVQRSGAAEPIQQVDSNKVLAWANGRLVFENDTIAAVVTEFNRYNKVQMHVGDERVAARPISGVFNADDPESFLAFLQVATRVRIVRGDDKNIVIASTN